MTSKQYIGLVAEMLHRRQQRENKPMSYEEIRADDERRAIQLPPDPSVKYRPITIGGTEAEWAFVAGAPRDKAVLYIHGGAFALRSVRTNRNLATGIAMHSCINTLSIGYRLAPEHPYPAAFQDTMQAWRWLLSQGFRSDGTVLAGESAGGTLALALTLELKEKGEPLPSALVLMSPGTDFTCGSPSIFGKADSDPMLEPGIMEEVARIYVREHSLLDPHISPLFGDYHGFPPMLIQAGTEDILFDDSTRLAKKARDSGTEARLSTWSGLCHAFQIFYGILTEAEEAVKEIGSYVRARLDK